MVLLMENAKVARCLPGTPRPFGKLCCQLSAALPASRGACSPFLEKLRLKTEFVHSKINYFFAFSDRRPNAIARQFFYSGHCIDVLQKPRKQKMI